MLTLRGAHFTLVSPYTPEQCVERLRAVTASRAALGLVALFSHKPLVGELDAATIRLSKLARSDNFMKPEFVATLEPFGSGTRLDCCIGLPLASLVLLLLAAVVSTSVGCCVGLDAIITLVRGEIPPETAWMPPLLTVFLFATILYGRWLASGEREFLEAMLTEQLEARRT